MARTSMTVTICDVCGREADLVWNVHGPERSYVADLCEEHDGELREALERFFPEVNEERPSRRGELTADFKARLRSLPEIE